MKKVVKGFAILSMGIASIAILGSCGSTKKEIAVIKFGTHTSLDEIETNINNKLNSNINKDIYSIKNYDCNFQSDLITQTLDGLNKDELACIICIATPTAVAAANKFDDVPIVFSAVSDPVSAGVVGDNVTGVSDSMQLDKLIDLSFEVDSDDKRFGYIYTLTEANSLANLTKLQALATERGFSLEAKGINNAGEITEAFNSMSDKVDQFIVTDDNNVASSMDTFADLCSRNKIKMYCAADSEVKDGAMMGYSINYSLLGTYTADYTIEIVNGKKPNELAVKYFQASDLGLFYNSSFLENSKITISEEILKRGTDLK